MTLHQVDVALARFERIIGLRDGKVAFDLPTREVTPERLRQLYLQHEEELVGPAPGDSAETNVDTDKLPPVMHCR